MFHQCTKNDIKFMSVDAAQFCLCRSPTNCLFSMNKSARRNSFIDYYYHDDNDDDDGDDDDDYYDYYYRFLIFIVPSGKGEKKLTIPT